MSRSAKADLRAAFEALKTAIDHAGFDRSGSTGAGRLFELDRGLDALEIALDHLETRLAAVADPAVFADEHPDPGRTDWSVPLAAKPAA